MAKATVQEFAAAVRKANPGAYDDITDDHQLVEAVLKAHPQYGDDVDLRTFRPTATLRAPSGRALGDNPGSIAEEARRRIAANGAAPVAEPPGKPISNMSDEHGVVVNTLIGAGDTLGNVALGGVKSAGKTLANIDRFARGATYGDFDAGAGAELDKSPSLEPHGIAQHVGGIAEQVGEYTLGEGAVNGVLKGAGVLQRVAGGVRTAEAALETAKTAKAAGAAADVVGATRALRTAKAARAALNVGKGVAVGGGVAAAEGGDVTTGAVIGGVGTAATEGVAAIADTPLAAKLIESAKKSYERTLGATKEAAKRIAGKVVGGYEVAGEKVPGLIDRGVTAWTRRGLSEKAAEEVSNLGEQIDNLWQSLPEGEKLTAAPIQQAIAAAKKELQETTAKTVARPTGLVDASGKPLMRDMIETVTTDIEPAAVRNLDRMKRIIDGLTDDTGTIDAQKLRKVKGILDGVVAGKGGYAGKTLSLSDSAGVLARKELANAIREELAQKYPDIAKINREFHFWKQVENVIGETLERTSSQSQPMGQQIAKVAGSAATGGHGTVKALLTGEAMGQLRKITTSAGWNTKVAAATKLNLARVLASGDATAAARLIGKIAFSVGVAGSRTQAEEYIRGTKR